MTGEIQAARIRVGVIGLGFGGETALRAYKELPDVEVVALAGLEEQRLAYLGETYGVPQLYPNYEDLLEQAEIDAVSVAVPNYLHAPVAVAALKRGLHVLCEKPLARTRAEAEIMVQAARDANRVLQVVFNHRQRGDVQFLKRYIDDGGLGEIYYAKAFWMRRHGIPGRGSWFVNKELSGGGPFIDLGVHVLDIALYLLGEPEVLTVSASTFNKLGSLGLGFDRKAGKTGTANTFDVEDLGTAFLRLANGTTIHLETSWATHSSAEDDLGVILYGTKGGAEIRVRNHASQNTLRIYTDLLEEPAEIAPHLPDAGYHKAVIREFIDNIKSGEWSEHYGNDGLLRTTVIDACYMSALQGREIVLGAD